MKKEDKPFYCKIFGHRIHDGQCVVCKMSLTKLFETGEVVIEAKGSESGN